LIQLSTVPGDADLDVLSRFFDFRNNPDVERDFDLAAGLGGHDQIADSDVPFIDVLVVDFEKLHLVAAQSAEQELGVQRYGFAIAEGCDLDAARLVGPVGPFKSRWLPNQRVRRSLLGEDVGVQPRNGR